MDVLLAIIIIIVALVLFYAAFKIIKGCLSKIVIGMIIVAGLGYLAYRFLTR